MSRFSFIPRDTVAIYRRGGNTLLNLPVDERVRQARTSGDLPFITSLSVDAGWLDLEWTWPGDPRELEKFRIIVRSQAEPGAWIHETRATRIRIACPVASELRPPWVVKVSAVRRRQAGAAAGGGAG